MPDPVAPVVPSLGSSARLRPLGLRAVDVTSGLWAERRRLNREVTILHGLRQLEAAGNLHNLRLAARKDHGTYAVGSDDAGFAFPFLDSDVYKWLEAVGWELAYRPDPSLATDAGRVIEIVAAAQRPDGYLNSYYQVHQPGQEFTNLQWGHELYTLGHLVQAAVAWFRGAGDDRLLAVAERAVARANDELGPGRRELVDGHPEIEMALVELYRTTGKATYLEFAKTLLERRGYGILGKGRYGPRYWQDHAPVRDAPTPEGHAVRQVYLDCGTVDVAVETGDDELLRAAIGRWEAMVGTKTYITGGLGSRHRDEAFGDPFELPPDRAYAETCAAIGSVMLAWRLLLATGERRFADHIERTAFNAVLPGLGLDGAHFFYSNPLQRRSDSAPVTEGAGANRRAPWFPCACCPPNLMRFLATFPDLVATSDGRGIELHQFAGATVTAEIGGGNVRLETRTDYPWDGAVEIEVRESVERPWTLSVRVPGWCSTVTADLDRTPLEARDGAIVAERTWRAGERLRIGLDMQPRVIVPDARIDAVRGTVALERGPLVYAIEDDDLPPNVPIEAIEVGTPVRVEALPPAPDAPLDGVVPLTVEAGVRPVSRDRRWPYRGGTRGPRKTPRSGEEAAVTVRAIPYFAWANRSSRGMRVWLPVRSPAINAETPGNGGSGAG